MNNSQPDSPENILKEYQLATRHAFIPDVLESHKQHALAKLDEYYANKFLEIIGEDEASQFEDGGEFRSFCNKCDFMPTDDTDHCICYYRNELRAELRQAIKQLSKRGE